MSRTASFERVVSYLLVALAACMAALVIKREVAPAASSASLAPATFVEGWREAVRVGTPMTDRAAPVILVEFLDLQCPACKYHHDTQLSRLNDLVDSALYRLVIVHLPLRSHTHARSAAVAAECAAEQSQFGKFVNAVLDHQVEIGSKSWAKFASESSVRDTALFVHCLLGSVDATSRVDSAFAVSERLGVSATPTFMANGWKYQVPPKAEQLAADIRALARNKSPYP